MVGSYQWPLIGLVQAIEAFVDSCGLLCPLGKSEAFLLGMMSVIFSFLVLFFFVCRVEPATFWG